MEKLKKEKRVLRVELDDEVKFYSQHSFVFLFFHSVKKYQILLHKSSFFSVQNKKKIPFLFANP